MLPSKLPVGCWLRGQSNFDWKVQQSPASSGAARAELTPGTSSAAIPAAESAASSLLIREKTEGQPPFKRATFFPCRRTCKKSIQCRACSC